MGPPSLDGGETASAADSSSRGTRLQWGPRLSTGGRRRGSRWPTSLYYRFNGAPVSRRGGGPTTVCVTLFGAWCFNGAPVSRRGGEVSALGLHRLRIPLQWGPRLSTGGSPEADLRQGDEFTGFNGAPVSRRGGVRKLAINIPPGMLLQWGPRLSTGGRSRSTRMSPPEIALQWGPRLSTGGRTSSSTSSGSSIGCFNGAPVSRRGGGVYHALRMGSRPMGFNGAPVSRRGGVTNVTARRRVAACFNGAPVSRRGGVKKLPKSDQLVNWASMGPPSLDGGEPCSGVKACWSFSLQWGPRLSTGGRTWSPL